MNFLKLFYKNTAMLTLLLANIGIALIVWLSNTPPPLLLNWDIYEHQTLINNLLAGKISFFTSQITDTFTFNGYPPTFHIGLAFLQKMFLINSLNSPYFWYYIQIVFFVITVTVQVYFVYKTTKNVLLVTISGIFSIYIFESFGSYSSLFLLPQTVAGILGAILIAKEVDAIQTKQSIFKPSLLILSALTLITHYIIGFLALCYFVMIALVNFLGNKIDKKYNLKIGLKQIQALDIFCLALILVLFFVVNFNQLLTFNPISNLGATGNESIELNLSMAQKLFHVKNWYGNFLIIFFTIGVIKSFFGSKAYKIISILSLTALILFFFPFPYTTKFFVLSRYFINTTMALGVFAFLSPIKNINIRFLGLMLLSFSLFVVFSVNISWYKNTSNKYNRLNTHFSPAELDAATFLSKTYPNKDDFLIVSDPSTMYVLEAFSGVNSQGGAYTSQKTRLILIDINRNNNPLYTAHRLYEVADNLVDTEPKKVLFVLSGRYFIWQNMENDHKLSITKNVYFPVKLSLGDQNTVSIYQSSNLFKQVYRNSDMVIFEVTKP